MRVVTVEVYAGQEGKVCDRRRPLLPQLKDLKSLYVLIKLVWPRIVTDVGVSRKEYMYSYLFSPSPYILPSFNKNAVVLTGGHACCYFQTFHTHVVINT
jgi:hypothetical protein